MPARPCRAAPVDPGGGELMGRHSGATRTMSRSMRRRAARATERKLDRDAEARVRSRSKRRRSAATTTKVVPMTGASKCIDTHSDLHVWGGGIDLIGARTDSPSVRSRLSPMILRFQAGVRSGSGGFAQPPVLFGPIRSLSVRDIR